MTDELRVIETESGKVVSTIDVSRLGESQLDRCEMGLMRNMNLEAFHVERYSKDQERMSAPTDEEIIRAVSEWNNRDATYVVRNRLAYRYKGIKTAYVLRRLKALEKAGRVIRVPSNYAVMICWAAVSNPIQRTEP